MEIQWQFNNGIIKEIYWSKDFSLMNAEQKGIDCNQLRIWYPQNIDENIYKRYGDVLTYIEKNGRWKGKAYSLIIDLSQDEDDIMRYFSQTRRYETKRAMERDNLHTDFYKPVNLAECKQFIEFYNQFAQTKGLANISEEKINALVKSERFIVAKISSHENEILCMHGYIADKESNRVALYTSSSLFREKKDIANLTARANGLLHYKSMLHFKDEGYLIYDFGGAYMGNDDIQLQNITKYKMSFGGKLFEFDNGVIIPFKIIRETDNFIKNNKNVFENKKLIIWGAAQYGKYLIYRMNQLSIPVSCVIDNKLSCSDNNYMKEDVLRAYDPKNTIVIVTTNIDNYEKIAKQEICNKFVESNNLISLKKEILRGFIS